MKKAAILLSKSSTKKPSFNGSKSQQQQPKFLGGIGSFGYPREGAPLSDEMKEKISKKNKPPQEARKTIPARGSILTPERLKWLIANKRLEMLHGGNPFLKNDPARKAFEAIDKGQENARRSKIEAERRKQNQENNIEGYKK